MFNWYRESDVCYAYLEDVDATEDIDRTGDDSPKAKWFGRGWTLQELIAPKRVRFFYSKDWKILGNKSSLAAQISRITGINQSVLDNGQAVKGLSVAKRMSWASRRYTTRDEDEAYCLLGIFGVNMPSLYGEGRRAFARLQEEIMKQSSDHSLFAWDPPILDTGRMPLPFGALATSPAAFRWSSNVAPFGANTQPYALTNQGLSIRLPLLRNLENGERFIGILDCSKMGAQFGFAGIVLEALDEDNKIFERSPRDITYITPKELEQVEVRDIYIVTASHSKDAGGTQREYVLTRVENSAPFDFKFVKIFTAEREWRVFDNQLVDSSLVRMEGPSILNIVGRLVVLCTYGGHFYGVLLECGMAFGRKHAAVEIDTFPRSDPSFIKERTQGLLKGGLKTSGQFVRVNCPWSSKGTRALDIAP
jgi:hypothetical protein